MSAMRLLLDENVDPLYRQELLRREPTLVVWRVGDIRFHFESNISR
jgi:hypothetical protein